MPPKKENHTRFNINIPNELLERVKNYQFKNKHEDRNEAIQALLIAALERDEKGK